jgi:predicted secreted protein
MPTPQKGTSPGAGAAVRRAAPIDDVESAALTRLFGGRVINQGAGMIALDAPCSVAAGADLTLSVIVNWAVVLAKAVAHLYVIADENHRPLLARTPLLPDLVPPHVWLKVRLDASGYVRAVVECGDGTLLQVARWIWVMPAAS